MYGINVGNDLTVYHDPDLRSLSKVKVTSSSIWHYSKEASVKINPARQIKFLPLITVFMK